MATNQVIDYREEGKSGTEEAFPSYQLTTSGEPPTSLSPP